MASTSSGESPVAPSPIRAQRLTLVHATAEIAALAARRDPVALGAALVCEVPPDWPPWTLEDALDFIAAKLRERPQDAGWWTWYMIAEAGVLAPARRLIGTCGVMPPDEHGRSLCGYGVVPSAEGRGLTSEAFLAFLAPGGWLMSQPCLKVLEATTFERHPASRRILEKAGFVLIGVSRDDAQAAESDRQGRGPLLLYRHPARSCA